MEVCHKDGMGSFFLFQNRLPSQIGLVHLPALLQSLFAESGQTIFREALRFYLSQSAESLAVHHLK